MYKLYMYPGSGNCYKLQLLLNQLDQEYEPILVDILQGQSRQTDFTNKNANGRVPLLQIDDKYLPESNAALWYLAQGTAYWPSDTFEQAQVLQWMFFEQYSHEPNIATVRYWVHIANNAEQHQQAIEQKMPAGYAALDVMEQHLANQAFFVGSDYSIADIALYAYTHVAHEGGFDLDLYPHILQWLKQVESTEGFIAMKDCPLN